MIANIKYKGIYIGSLFYLDKLGKKCLTGKGNYAILKNIVNKTKGVIEDDVYLKMLPNLLPKDYSVQLDKGIFKSNTTSSPEAMVKDIALTDRRTF